MIEGVGDAVFIGTWFVFVPWIMMVAIEFWQNTPGIFQLDILTI